MWVTENNADAGRERALGGNVHRRDVVIAWVTPVLLVLLAVTQIAQASTRDLTPWKGGGFGMFASTDGLNYRAVQARFLTTDEPITIAVHDFGDEERAAWRFTHARAMPDERRVARLVERIERAQWTVDRRVAQFDSWLPDALVGPVVTSGRSHNEQVITVTGVQIEVWGTFYTRGDDQLEPRMLASHTFMFGDRQ